MVRFMSEKRLLEIVRHPLALDALAYTPLLSPLIRVADQNNSSL